MFECLGMRLEHTLFHAVSPLGLTCDTVLESQDERLMTADSEQ